MVVLYHAGFDKLSGGFIGVDIFFVVSGFLITKIIYEQRKENSFSILAFYSRRVRRIIPALAAMVAVILISSAFWMLPDSLERASHSALAAILFVANIYFWHQSNNYFSPASETDPFLHTWSLAVEEQFYILFPIIFLILFFAGRRGLIFGFTILSVISFASMIAGYMVAPTVTFFLPVTRAWEFLVGSFLALSLVPRINHQTLSNIFVFIGLGLILFTALVIDKMTVFPSWVTLLPALGAALIIQFGETCNGIISLLMSSKPIVWIGKISYSLYLWHWPIFVLTEHYWLQRELTVLESISGIIVSVCAAYLSYRFIEQPFRKVPRLSGFLQRSTIVPASQVVIAISTAFVLALTDGLESRHPDFSSVSIDQQTAEELPFINAIRADCFLTTFEGRSVDGCTLSPSSNRRFLVLGDSFAEHYLAAFQQSLLAKESQVLSFTSPQCPPIVDYDPANLPSCRLINEKAQRLIDEMNVDTVILSANWFNYTLVNRISFDDIRKTIRSFHDQDLNVVFIGQSPIFHFTSPEEAYYKSLKRGIDPGIARNGSKAEFLQGLAEAAQEADIFLDPSNLLCDGESCVFHDKEKYIVSDYGHLTLYGAQFVVDRWVDDIVHMAER